MSAPWIVAFAVTWAVVAVLAVLVLGLLRRITGVLELAESRLSELPTGPAIGGAAPGTAIRPFTIKAADAQTTVEFLRLQESAPAIYLFMNSSCRPCKRLANELGRHHESIGDVPLYVILNEGEEEFGLTPGPHVFSQSDREASEAFMNDATPQAFLVDRGNRVVEKSIPNAIEDLRQLARKAPKGGEAIKSVRTIDGFVGERS